MFLFFFFFLVTTIIGCCEKAFTRKHVEKCFDFAHMRGKWKTLRKWVNNGLTDCLYVNFPAGTGSCERACVPMLQHLADVTKHVIGLLITNTCPLIFMSSPFSSSLSLHLALLFLHPSHPPTHPCLPFLPLYFIFPPIQFLFSFQSHTPFSRPVLFLSSQTSLSIFICLFFFQPSPPNTYFSKFFPNLYQDALCPSFKHRMSQYCSTTMLWFAAQLTSFPPFPCISFHSVIWQSCLMSLAASVIHR